ncbi:hypothetical protein DD238_003239 [Peronospora effusa]|uniref:Uncharacterized protein n=1 Tax=Peronospora effusa TaxID=542832 RepID=A0A3M6VPB3_9STRA|nr:hypothetical protein DD238_003239 [Peronospora effusa]
MVGLDAMGRLLYLIRSLPGEEYRELLTLLKNQPRLDRIRAIIVELLRFLNRACRDHGETALSLLLPKRSALMALCSILLYASSFLPSTSPTQLVELIHLFYHRLGKHVICSLTYFSDTGSAADNARSLAFSQQYSAIEEASIWDEEKLTKKSDEESYEEADKEEGVKEGKYLFQMEACQCYCCLYDVQILLGCQDHK